MDDFDPNYKPFSVGALSQEESDANEKEAIRRYFEGEQPSSTTFIDEVTMNYGYGKLDGWIGVWEYNIPHHVLSRGEPLKWDLETRSFSKFAKNEENKSVSKERKNEETKKT